MPAPKARLYTSLGQRPRLVWHGPLALPWGVDEIDDTAWSALGLLSCAVGQRLDLMDPHVRTAVSRIFSLGLLSVLLGGAGPAGAEIVLSEYRVNHPLKIMPIGDSITDDCVYNGAWRRYLQPLLDASGYPFLFVGRQGSGRSGQFTKTLHEGYCGAVIAPPGMMTIPVHGYAGTNVYLLKTIADTLTNATLRPDLVLVVMGANDIGRGRDPYFVANHDMPQLLDLIFSNAPAAHIILTKTTTLSNAVSGYMTNAMNVPVYNGALQEMVKGRQALGQKVFLADMFSAVDYSTMFESDHLHPNPKGLSAMAAEFFSRIQAITLRTNGVASTLIPGGAEWKYADAGQDLGSAWTGTDYDDSAWNHGPARLGFGDPVVVTTLRFGPDPANKPPTFYFRHAFAVPEHIAYTNLNFRLARSDGAVVWLNGQEVFRTNLPSGPITFTNLALQPVSGEAAYIFYPANLAVAPLPAGTNVVAVEIHASSPGNPSLGFDLELLGTGYAVPPSISAAVTGGNISIRWSATNRVSYALFSTESLTPSTVWSSISASVQTNNNQCVVTVPLGSTPRFFRLQKQ